MQFSSFAALSGLMALASATFHTQTATATVAVVCTDPAPSVVTQTVTVTAGAPDNHVATTTRAPYVVTAGGSVTSVDYSGKRTSVWVYPTGSPSHDCVVAVYEEVLIQVIIVNINVTVINNTPTTVTVTKTDKPTWTPSLPTNTKTTATSSPTYTATPKIHNVTVGADGLFIYRPNDITADIGDIIRFDFLGRNHTVTQSDFNTPCTPNGKFDTGFSNFNPMNISGSIVKDFKVTVSTPLWFFCAQTTHCQKGMVMGVNSAGKFPQFLAKALASGNSTSTAQPSTTAKPTTTVMPTATGGSSSIISTYTKAANSTTKTPMIKGRKPVALRV